MQLHPPARVHAGVMRQAPVNHGLPRVVLRCANGRRSSTIRFMPSCKPCSSAARLTQRARRFGAALALACLALPALGQSDADLLRAKDAFDRGDRRRLDALAPALTGHILEPY